jgi:hypothetical protein
VRAFLPLRVLRVNALPDRLLDVRRDHLLNHHGIDPTIGHDPNVGHDRHDPARR